MVFCGYDFKDERILEEALTTPSCKMVSPGIADNQRLEFLGDAVLGLLSAERLYREHPKDAEGELTIKRTHMVSAVALCEAADRLNLVDRLKTNEHSVRPARNSKTIADAVEAILGAAYVDGGLSAAKAVFDNLGLSDKVINESGYDNPKGVLQTITQAMSPRRMPTYRLLRTEGCSHAPVFTVEVSVEGIGCESASAKTRREAESAAAEKLLLGMKSRKTAI